MVPKGSVTSVAATSTSTLRARAVKRVSDACGMAAGLVMAGTCVAGLPAAHVD